MILLRINTEGDAFQFDSDAEVARIMGRAKVHVLACGPTTLALHDFNGNICGTLEEVTGQDPFGLVEITEATVRDGLKRLGISLTAFQLRIITRSLPTMLLDSMEQMLPMLAAQAVALSQPDLFSEGGSNE
jgi:hypothetical protein